MKTEIRRVLRCRGFSILELSLVLLLLGLILVTVSRLFGSSLSTFHRGEVKIELQQSTFKVMDHLGADMRESVFRSFYFIKKDGAGLPFASFPMNGSVSVKAVCFATAYGPDGNYVYDPASAMPLWQKFAMYYLLFDQKAHDIDCYRLYKKEWTPGVGYYFPAIAPFPISYTDLTARINDAQDARLIASNITDLSFYNPSLGQIGIKVTAAKVAPSSRKVEQSALDTRVFMRNEGFVINTGG